MAGVARDSRHPTKPGLPPLGNPFVSRLDAKPEAGPFDVLKLLSGGGSGKGFEDLLCFKDRRKAKPKSPMQRV